MLMNHRVHVILLIYQNTLLLHYSQIIFPFLSLLLAFFHLDSLLCNLLALYRKNLLEPIPPPNQQILLLSIPSILLDSHGLRTLLLTFLISRFYQIFQKMNFYYVICLINLSKKFIKSISKFSYIYILCNICWINNSLIVFNLYIKIQKLYT